MSIKSESVPKKCATDYKFCELLGYGAYSEVYAAVEKSSNCAYAIKQLNKKQIMILDRADSVQRERAVMIMMNDVPGFVKLVATCQDYNSLYLVMTYAKNGDLQKALDKFGAFDLNCVRHYAAELLLACEQMHQRHVLHLDIKTGNILLDDDMHILITDFGSTHIFSEIDADVTDVDVDAEETKSEDSKYSNNFQRRRSHFGGTVPYIAPELLISNSITPLNDLWALGCFIYETTAGLPPFRDDGEFNTLTKIRALEFDFPQGFDEIAKDLVQQLLKYPADQRLGSNDENYIYTSIRSHAFFAGIDFEKIRQMKPPEFHPYLPGLKTEVGFPKTEKIMEEKQLLLDNNELINKNVESKDDNTEELNDASSTMELTNQFQNELTMNTTTTTSSPSTTTTIIENVAKVKQQPNKLFSENEDIIRKDYVSKWKGLFSTKFMLILTTGPHLLLVDSVNYKKKEEIEWTFDLKVEAKNSHVFFIYTPKIIYYIEDTEGCASEWTEDILKIHKLSFQ